MKITYNPIKNDFYVGEQTLREFYVQARRESGMTISKVEQIAGVNHPTLFYLEFINPQAGKKNNSTRALLVGLEALGYEVELTSGH